MNGVELIAVERQRQIEQEGWTPEHDDEHRHDELARAAAVYATPQSRRFYLGDAGYSGSVPRSWPWSPRWWKPSPNDRIRELVKAGALIAAEIDRIQRSVKSDDARKDGGE